MAEDYQAPSWMRGPQYKRDTLRLLVAHYPIPQVDLESLDTFRPYEFGTHHQWWLAAYTELGAEADCANQWAAVGVPLKRYHTDVETSVPWPGSDGLGCLMTFAWPFWQAHGGTLTLRTMAVSIVTWHRATGSWPSANICHELAWLHLKIDTHKLARW